jgi:hypothetical protein
MEINREHAMITGLDHVVVLLDDIKAGAAAYELLLARAPAWRSHNDGAETVMFTLDNMTLELMAPASSGPPRIASAACSRSGVRASPASASASATSPRCIAGSTALR